MKRILIIEDDEMIRGNIEGFLQRSGFQVTVSGSGDHARKLVLENDFDLIVSDLYLDGSQASGIDVVRTMKKTKSTPFILMTAFSLLQVQDEAIASGVDEMTAKPFKMEVLLELIMKQLAARPSE